MDQKTIDALYASALRIRIVEETLASIYHLQEMKTPSHFSLGKEAIAAGVCTALETQDPLYSTYRCHGWYLAKGGKLDGMIGELYGKSSGCSKGFGGSMHLIDLDAGFAGTSALVSAAVPHAVGAAFALSYKNSKNVAVSVAGDAATEEGDYTESVMFALLRKLPIVFVCENDELAVNSHLRDRQPPTPIHERIGAIGLPTTYADGNDAVAVYEATKEAVARARSGGGPSFLEFKTWRPIEHCGPLKDFDVGFRSAKEAELWTDKDPIARMEKRVSASLRDQLRGQYRKEAEASIARSRAAAFPKTLDPELV